MHNVETDFLPEYFPITSCASITQFLSTHKASVRQRESDKIHLVAVHILLYPIESQNAAPQLCSHQ